MEIKTFLAAFGLIFIAELGDKTQLAVMGLVTKSNSPLSVFLGAGAALLCATLLGVLFGEAILKIVPKEYIRIAAGSVFILAGGLILLRG